MKDINSQKKLFLVNEFITLSITAGLSTRNRHYPSKCVNYFFSYLFYLQK